MFISTRRKLAVGAAGLIVLAGSGGAYAATQSTSSPPDPAAGQKAFLDDVAGRLHVTTDQLTQALKGAAQDRVDAAVKAGRLTQAQADKIKQRISQAKGLPLVPGPRIGRGPLQVRPGAGLRFGPGFGPFADLSAAAKYLGLTDRQLLGDLRNGKSLADVAKAQGKTTDGLKAALKAAQTAQLDAAVKAGRLTDAQRTKIEANLDQRLDNLINGTRAQMPAFPKLRRWP